MIVLCLVYIAVSAVELMAAEFTTKGLWIMSFDVGDGGNFSRYTDRTHQARTAGYKGFEDTFEARQRVRFQLDIAASPTVSGTVQVEIGDSIWGRSDQNAGLGIDGTNIKVKQAYLTWIIPDTDVIVRMGRQGIALPSATTKGSEVLDDNGSAVVVSYTVNEMLAVTALWSRFYNDNYSGGSAPANSADNADTFALLLPMHFPDVLVTPWVAYANIGPNAFRADNDHVGEVFGYLSPTARRALFPNYFTYNSDRWKANGENFDSAVSNRPSHAIWMGLTGAITALEPWRFAWDVNYGAIKHEFDWLDRKGWYVSALTEYTFDSVIPGVYGWYSSGDDANPSNGSERLPSMSPEGDNTFSSGAFSGNSFIGREKLFGHSMSGTWGIGARLKDIRFVDDLKHTVRLNYMGGTNSPEMAKYMTGSKVQADPYASGWGNRDFNSDDKVYMTTNDNALEAGLSSEYSVYENFVFYLDATYVKLWLDNDTWKAGRNSVMQSGANAVHHVSIQDAWNVNLSCTYSF